MTHPNLEAHPDSARLPVVVVGAGMAGLTAAVALHEANVPVRIFEAGDGVGGRVRSDRHPEGFILDRGYQVLLDAYPAARRWIDHDALDVGKFDAGALLWTGKRLVPLADPLRHPENLLRDLTTSLFPASDKARFALLAAKAGKATWQTANEAATSLGNDVTASEYLWSLGFSERFVDRFARPFWGGITLEPHLTGSAGPLLFTAKMFMHGRAVLPAEGVGAMPAQLAARLPEEAISLNATVTSIEVDDGRATGVRVGGEVVPAAAVIVATDPPTAASLAPVRTLPTREQGLPSVTVYLGSARRPETGPRLVLDSTRRLAVNTLSPITEVQPSYAPAGQHLLAAEIVGELAHDPDLDALAERARRESATMLGHDAGDWRVLDVVHLPFSQFAQPPGIYRRLPGNVTPIGGLYLANEATVDSSYNGAMTSGEIAAGLVRRELAFAQGVS
jgi:phytoene dehydrogenase-like protein